MPKKCILSFIKVSNFLPALLIGLVVSCVSIRKNYLGSLESPRSDLISWGRPSAQIKLQHEQKADSLLQIILAQQQRRKLINAQEINQLYSGFGEQLNADRYYHSLLQASSLTTDSLSPEQYDAVVELLASAASYERVYQPNEHIRRSMNRGDKGNSIPKLTLQKSRNFLYSPSIRKTINAQHERLKTAKTDSLLSLLPETNFRKAVYHRVFRQNDRIHSFMYNSVYAGSYVVGNTIGIFHEDTDRKPNSDLLRTWLRPFDLVVMKSPHHFTDQFIPGYFGHVGIWLGDGIIAQLNNQITEKKDSTERAMIEALRSGVQISTLDEFVDGEIFLIMRLSKFTNRQKDLIVSNVRKQLSKDYDFNFDIESPEAITCTELVYLSYDFIDWQFRYTMSRYTISPDDLVQTAIKSKQFEFPVLIKNGIVFIQPDTTRIQSLIRPAK